MNRYLDYLYRLLNLEDKIVLDKIYKAGTLYQSEIKDDNSVAKLVAFRVIKTTSYFGIQRFDVLSLSEIGVELYEDYILPEIDGALKEKLDNK